MAAMLDHATLFDSVGDFLHETSQLHHSLCEIHDHGSNSTKSVAVSQLQDVSKRLRDGVHCLAHHSIPTNDGSDLDSLAVACHIVCRDLLVHLERVDLDRVDLDKASPLALCTTWPLHDVEALGDRLREMNVAWSSVVETHSRPDNLTHGLTNLAIGPDVSAGFQSSINPKQEQGASFATESTNPNQAQKKQVKPNLVSNGILEDFILDGLAFSSMKDREEEVTLAHRQTFEWIFGKGQETSRATNLGSDFVNWLTTNDLGPIYWITGKPGSGKSTLTRFLFDNDFTRKYLKIWSFGRPVAMASFYFWTSGSHEQKSQTGLLRYLLHQLLSVDREVIPYTFPTLWQRLLKISTKERIKLSLGWTASELMTAFHSFMEIALEKMNICLFIDGLDEFEGDRKMIINFFKDLVQGDNGSRVKLCLSSRPWPVFESAFEHSVPNLKLQKLTYGDMHRYTEDRLVNQVHTGLLTGIDAEDIANIADDAVKKADGVFLWVRLAANQMLEHAKQDATASGLRKTLQSLPGDLDDLFERLIFEHKTPQQLSDTATIFQLIRARELVSDFIKDESAHSLTVWELGFAFENADNEVAITGTVGVMNEDEVADRTQAIADYLRRGFSGLLDVYIRRSSKSTKVRVLDLKQLTEGKINFIHRTVRDWLLGPRDVEARLHSHSPDGFDPHLYLLRSYVVQMKRPLSEPERHRRLDEWWPDIALAMSHARYVTQDPCRLLRPFMNELNNTIASYWVTRPKDPEDHWAKHAFGAYEVRMKAPPIKQPFLCLSTKFGITQYIREELNALTSSETQRDSRTPDLDNDGTMEEEDSNSAPLLSYAVEFLCSRKKTIYPLSDPDLVECLLTAPSQRGKGPNSSYADFTTRMPLTPWLALLRHLRDARRRGWIEYYDTDPSGTLRWSKIVRLFLKHGADANAIILKDMWDPEVSAIGVLEMLEDTYGSAEVKEIRELMQQMAEMN